MIYFILKKQGVVCGTHEYSSQTDAVNEAKKIGANVFRITEEAGDIVREDKVF